MSGSSTWTQWMARQSPDAKTPSRKRYATGEQPRAVTAMPRARNASANGPAPSCTSAVSSRDSARCRATGSRSRRASSAVARYSGSLTVYGACGEMGQLEVGVAIDKAGDDDGLRVLAPLAAFGVGNAGARSDRRDAAALVNKNGAVLDGRRRDGMNRAGADAQHASAV